MIRAFLIVLLLSLAACGNGQDNGPLRTDVIGEAAALADPIRRPPSEHGAFVLDAMAQGLVAIDADGEIEPALARRWTVLDDGRTYIFRLDDFVWQDGTALTAGQIARQLRAARRGGPRSRVAPVLTDIEEVNAVTPQILEVRLTRPRLDFLHILASAELAMVIENEGLGPYALADGYALDDEAPALLSPLRPPIDEEDDETAPPPPIAPEETVELHFTRAALAVARFDLGRTDIVLGGRWTTLPLAEAIDPAAANLVLDPTDGLFGLAFVEQAGFLANADNRRVLSMTVDRAQLVALLGRDEAEAREVIMASDAEDIAPVAAPAWIEADLEGRRQFGRAAVSIWRAANGEIEPLRIALPDEPGSRPIFAILRNSWRAIGIEVERVAWDADADLRLVDRIAATPSASWYLQQFHCERGLPCSQAYEEALSLIDETRSPRAYALRIADAAAELEAMTPFIPLLRPIRWSLISSRISGFRANRYASHPLDTLLDGGD
ncbi:MAG: ABC transporter substrate-binding protein [Sphingomonadaceae bacterium]|nr:ABC transporter substrate-binding protein [Sphingomonadaceae bacterium]